VTRLGRHSRPSLTIEGIERAVELTSWKLTGEGGDDSLTVRSTVPDRIVHLEGAAYQSTTRGTLWRFAYEHSGEVVSFRLAPYGNEIPTEDEPHYTGRLIVGLRPDIGGDATDRWFAFEFSWAVIGEPDEVIS
jgi:hypothetical protein